MEVRPLGDFTAMNMRWVPIACAAFALTTGAAAQETPVHWAMEPMKDVAAGRTGRVAVRAVIDSAWHVYGLTQPRPPIALKFTLDGVGVTMGKPVQPKPTRRFDDAFGIETEFFERAVTFQVPFTVARSAKPGAHQLTLSVQYQACTERVCLPPTTEDLAFQVTVLAPATRDTPAIATIAARAVSDTDAVGNRRSVVAANAAAVGGSEKGLGSFILFAALMGLVALTTPCVFPMVPITVSYFTRRGTIGTDTRPRAEALRDAAVYGGGIIAAFTGLGLLLALLYGATGINRFAANPWVNLMVAALFIAFALDLLGAWEFRLPWQLVNRVNTESQRGGMPGLLFMGVAFAVTTFTCTVPFVGTLLVSAASGSWTRPILGMLAFSTMFALPFVLLALFPSLLRSLPKSGSWMGTFKITLGLVELGAALKFLSNADLVWQLGILQRTAVIASWIALALLGALHLLGLLRLPFEGAKRAEARIGVGRMLSGGVFVAIALFLLPGLMDRPVGAFDAFLPPRDYPGSTRATGALEDGNSVWLTDYAAAAAASSSTGRSMFIDFTGYTCTNCRWMESNVFNRPDIRERLEQYVLVRLYTDGRGDEHKLNQKMQLDRFGTIALPFYAIIAPDGNVTATFPGLTRKAGEFAAFLDSPVYRSVP